MSNWDEDIDFLVGKRAAKQGRRATNQEEKSPDEVKKSSSAPKVKKSGVWGDEGNKSAKSRSTNLIEQERFLDSKNDDSDDDIPIIPDIEELQDDSYKLQDLQHTTVSVNKATYKELDSDFLRTQTNQSALGKLSEINVSILSEKLLPESDVQDPDVIWTMPALLKRVISEINAGEPS